MACDPFRILKITDGTVSDAGIRNEVNLLAETSGFCLTEWEPAIADLKGGGVWSDSPISDGRRLRFAKAENVREVMTLEVQDWNADALITDTQALRRLLEKARAWGTAQWQREEVWIEAQGVGETNLRYAIITDYRTQRDGNPYDQPFWQRLAKAGMSEFQLILERRPFWTSNEPGTETATEISAVETYDGRNLGNVDDTGSREPTTAEGAVYAANKRNEANISDIYVDDGGVFGANLMDAALPYNLLPAVPAVNDAIYFGIDTALADSGPFSSLVFDIGTAITNVTTILWQQFDGVGWSLLNVQDNTNANGAGTGVVFDTTGIRSVHWEPRSGWVTRDLSLDGGPAITGYWVRAIVTAIGVGPTAPVQQNRDVYSIISPYVEIQESAVGGDIVAIARISARNQADTPGGVGLDAWSNREIVGLRSMSRGTNFSAYLNWADEQNPAGVTVTTSPIGGIGNAIESPTGRCVSITPPAAPATQITMQLDSSLAPEYFGTYHGFLRAQQLAGVSGDITFQLRGEISGVNQNVFLSFDGSFQNTNTWQIFDLGRVSIPSIVGGAVANVTNFRLIVSGTGAIAVRFYDLILIPVDEWAADCLDTINSSFSRIGNRGLTDSKYLDIDAITDTKRPAYLVKLNSSDEFTAIYLGITGGPTVLQANSRQRLWFFWTRFPSLGSSEERAEPRVAYSIQVSRNQRYLSMRGNR
jgi:hypothetical protein